MMIILNQLQLQNLMYPTQYKLQVYQSNFKY